MTLIYAIIMICILIFVHELGHFVAAKACGVKVNEFALGMGPLLLKKQKGETLYSLRAIPIGGFCAMEGEDEDSEDERAFNNKPAWKKAIILVAGAAMNIVVAVILMMIVSFFIGVPTTKIDSVVDNSPAKIAGIEAQDKIVSVDNEKIGSWYKFTEVINDKKGGEEISIVVDRGGEELRLDMPVAVGEDGNHFVGVTTSVEKHSWRAILDGPRATWNMAESMYTVIKQLITGEVKASNLSGPVGIVYMVDQSLAQGAVTFLYFMAMISLNLAVVNLLPFPALDGGRLIFVVIRKITGKAITDRMEGMVHLVGMALLLLLMIYVTWQDILRFIVPIFK